MLVYQRVDVNRPVSMNLPPGTGMIDIMENPWKSLEIKSDNFDLPSWSGHVDGMFKNLPSKDLPCSFVSILR